MLLSKMLEQIPGIHWTGNVAADIGGISYDSRSVQKGDLFVAIKGKKEDGARFIAQAIQNGAIAIAVEGRTDPGLEAVSISTPDARRFLAEISRIFYGDPSAELKLVGITGTKGKTTTSYLMESIYGCAGLRSCLAGTIETRIGEYRFHSSHTTPESADLMKFLRQAVDEKCTHGVMEVSSHSLELKRVYKTKFAVGVFMNLTHDHLDFHGDMESYFKAKHILFSEGNGNGIESAVINSDDPFGKRLAKDVKIPLMRFGFNEPAEIRAIAFNSRFDGMDLECATPVGKMHLRLHLIGRPNVYNVMAATGASLGLGLDLNTIRAGVEGLKGVPGRMELVNAGQDFSVIVDYAHSPDSLQNLLETVRQLPHEKVIVVFGCGGDRDRTKRPVMGEIAAKMSDFVFATSDNPRTEDPLGILKEIEPGLSRGTARYSIVVDRGEAIASAITMAKRRDVVVIAGKGHEDYQIIGTKMTPFDDRKLAMELILKRLGVNRP
ncbi:MAG TPA: UDP-N-acetylmuramoyl-L-alanyl-D-glutamate--2,6-diaminopimelate ligase [Acidobacteriota bacterium]|nr:UDP-N-acetylmuramoyl-L-alanyl-D-glutamate--2,6-diaminopimelate ligase [Acidobacteriota bacterium]